MDIWQLLLDIGLLLFGALVFGGIFSRFGQSPLVGYIVAGMVLGGPGSVQVVRFDQHVEAVAELGVSLLLFSLGLEFSWPRVRGLGNRVLAAGASQVVLTGIVGALAARLFGADAIEALVIGAMVSLSSTACVLRVLMECGEIDSIYGRNSLAVLLVQDMAVVPLAVLITAMTGGGTLAEIAANLAKMVFLAGALVATLYAALNVVAVRVLGTLTLERNRELTVLLAVGTGLGSAWAAHHAGISPALGAFVAGMFLGGSPFATQIRADVGSLRVVLLTLFFGSVGMVANPVWMLAHWQQVLVATASLMAGKTVLTWLVLRMIGQSSGNALAVGLGLSQIGEFAFVLASIARGHGALSDERSMVIVSSAILSLFLTPFVVPQAPKLGMKLDGLMRRARGRVSDREKETPRPRPEIVIIGFGPAGEAVGRTLGGTEKMVMVIDLNEEAMARCKALGLRGLVGDAQQADVLEHAGVTSAKVVVITLPSATVAMTVLHHVRRMAPKAHVVVRSRYQRNQSQFEAAGAHAVFGDEYEVGEKLAGYLRGHLGLL